MPYIDGSGLCGSISTANGEGSAIVWSKGASSCLATPLGRGNLIHAAHGLCEAVVTPLGHLENYVEFVPEARSSVLARITFGRGMLDNGALRSKYSYSLVPKFPTAVALSIVSVTPEAVTNPTYVNIETTEMTDGETYIATVNAISGPTDPIGIGVDPANNSVEYFGIGIDPVIESVTSITANLVEVKFSVQMLDNSAIRDATRYSFNNGLNVLSVVSVVGDTVTLATDDQIPGLLYALTVTP